MTIGENAHGNNRRNIAIAFAMVYLFWGSTFLAVRYAVQSIPPLMMVGARQFLAGIILYPIARLRNGEKSTRIQWLSGGLIGGLLVIGGNGSIAWAEAKQTPTSITAILVATVPLWMAILDWLRPGGPRPTGRVLVALGVGFLGVALLVGPGGPFLHSVGDSVSPLCAAVLVMGSMCWATGSILSRHLNLPKSTLLGTSIFTMAGGALTFPVALALGEGKQIHMNQISPHSGLAVLYLAVFGSVLGFSAYTYLLREVSPARVATYAYINPLVAVFLGWYFLGESLTLRMLVAAAIILAAVVLVITSPHPPEESSGQPVVPD